MAIYKANFKRINFDFRPALEQTADVVFETDIPCDDENIEEFEEFMWEEMWKQNPHWKNSEGPLRNKAGWSSVLVDSQIDKISYEGGWTSALADS